jgi:membrane protease YdiL (CAAX protease family)
MNASMILALPLVWVACAIAGYLYSQQQHIPAAIALAALPAFLLEATLFYVLGVERLRAHVERLPRAGVAVGLVLAAIAPYCAASLALGSFDWRALGGIAALAAAASFWYVLLPEKPATDVLFLVLLALVYLAKLFHRLYVSPHPKLPLETLGQLMWIRTGAFALLSVRRVKGVGFGFWPAPREWKIGAMYFALLAPVAAALGWWIGFAKPRMPALGWEKASLLAVATFFGILWVVALGEEFFFRGLLQQWVTGWLSSEWAGLLVTSVLFGAVHLWFRQFPNWRFAALAAVAGVFYGLSFRQAHSIRASMVTHALAVTAWRTFFG